MTLAILQAMPVWPVSVASWVGFILTLAGIAGGLLAYFKGHIIFKRDVEQRFEGLDHSPLKKEFNGLGARIDAILATNKELDARRRELLAEWETWKERIVDMEREKDYVRERLGESKQATQSCLDETRRTAELARKELTEINLTLREIQTELKHLNGGTQ